MSKSYHVPKDRDNKTNLVVSGLWQIQKDSMSVYIYMDDAIRLNSVKN